MVYRSKTESQKAIEECGEKCVICGWQKYAPNGKPLVERCHILDFSKDPNYDKKNNIIALCPNHHTEFDKHCFYIDSEKRTIVSYFAEDNKNGLSLNIDYVDKRCLAYRQYRVLATWNKMKNKK